MVQIWLLVKLRMTTTYRRLKDGAANIAELLLNIVIVTFLVFLSLSLGLLLGFLGHEAVTSGKPQFLEGFFHVSFLFFFLTGLLLPLFMSAGSQSLDARRYLLFPIGYKRLYLTNLLASFAGASHLLYLPSLPAIYIGAFLLPERGIITGLLIILLFFLAIAAWSNALLTLFQVILRKRSAKELIAVAVFSLFIALWLLLATSSVSDGEKTGFNPALYKDLIFDASGYLPSGIAAKGLISVHAGEPGEILSSALLLSLIFLAGTVIGYRAFHLQCFATGRTEVPVKKSSHREGDGFHRAAFVKLPFLSPETTAVAVKDLQYVFRSTLGKYNFIVTPVLIIGLGHIFGHGVKGSVLGLAPSSLVFFGLLLYASVFTNNLVLNAFAWEGGGIASYFLYPVPLGRIILGKNIAFWIYTAVLTTLSLGAYVLFAGSPGIHTLLNGVLLFGLLMITFAAGGNITSVMVPRRRDISALTKNAATGAGLIVMLSSLAGVFIVCSALVLVTSFLGIVSLLPVFLFLLLFPAAAVYGVLLKHTAALMEDRREKLINALQGRD